MDTQTQILSIVLTVVITLVGFLIYYILQKKKTSGGGKSLPKEYASGKVVSLLHRFSKSNGYRFLSAVPLQNGTTLDALCVGEFGLLGVKSYGYNGTVYGSAGDKEWVRIGQDGKREHFANPVLEANQDVQALRKALQNTKGRMAPIEVVVVFPNGKTQLAVEKKAGVLRMSDLKSLLGRDKYQKENGVDQNLIADTLQKQA